MWIYDYRELIHILTISDLRVKYQNSILGFAWSLLNPLLMMLVLYAVFSSVFQITQKQFAFYLLTGIIGWRFLANGSTAAMSAIVGKSSLVTKIYIPRQVLVLSTVLSCFICFILEFIVLSLLLLLFGINFSMDAVLIPAVFIVYLGMVYGLGLILGALYVYYRDLNQIWDVILQIGFFVSPIIYPISRIPAAYYPYYMLNPMTAMIQIFRGILLDNQLPTVPAMATIIVAAAVLLKAGSMVFKRLERRFAEEI